MLGELGSPPGSRIWEAGTGVSALALGPAGAREIIVAASWNGLLRVWDATSFEPMVSDFAVGLPPNADPEEDHMIPPIHALALGQVGGRALLIVGGGDWAVQVRDASSLSPLFAPMYGHDGSVLAVALGDADDRVVVVSGGQDGTVRLWDAMTGAAIGVPLHGHRGAVQAVAITRVEGRSVIVSGGADGTLCFWDGVSRTATADMVYPPVALAFDQTGRLFTASGRAACCYSHSQVPD
jgi:WD40 repeat protein